MNMIPEPYIIDKAEAQWLGKALGNDWSRKALARCAIVHCNGAAWLATTDTHRLHMLKLGKRDEFTTIMFDLRRVLLEAQFAKSTHVAISHDLTQITVGIVGKKSSEFNSIYAPVIYSDNEKFPDIVRVIPTTRNPVSELFAINSRYLVDATELSRKESHRTVMYAEGNIKPIVFTSTETDRWMAIVMPMNFDKNDEFLRGVLNRFSMDSKESN